MLKHLETETKRTWTTPVAAQGIGAVERAGEGTEPVEMPDL